MSNPDRWLASLEDRWAQRATAEDDERDVETLDEYGRPEDHPDHGFLGPSTYICHACKWQGDNFGSNICPDCRGELEATE